MARTRNGQTIPNYPGLGDQMSDILEEVIQGKLNPLTSRVNYKRTVLHCCVPIPASSSLTQFKFFNFEPSDPHVGNWSSGGLGQDQFAILYGMGFKVETGFKLDGTAVAGDQIIAGTTELALAEKLRLFYENGLVNMSVGERTVLENVRGLENFPAGVGIEGFAAFATTATTTSHGAAVVNNGNPFNRFEFTPPIVVLPQKKMKVQVDYKTAIAPAVECVLRCAIPALIVNPLNN